MTISLTILLRLTIHNHIRFRVTKPNPSSDSSLILLPCYINNKLKSKQKANKSKSITILIYSQDNNIYFIHLFPVSTRRIITIFIPYLTLIFTCQRRAISYHNNLLPQTSQYIFPTINNTNSKSLVKPGTHNSHVQYHK